MAQVSHGQNGELRIVIIFNFNSYYSITEVEFDYTHTEKDWPTIV